MAASAWNAAPALALDFLGDERLARLATRGDERAFGALYERYLPGLTRYCRSILRHSADAEDAAQNAMVSALKALEGGTVPIRVKPWLYKIAHNEAISLARRRKPSEELDEAMLPAVGDAEELSAIRERLGQLMADLQALTERQRQALVLRELYDFSYGDIAQTLGSTEAGAQQTVFEARSALLAFGEGRALDCTGVQRAMSDCDGMRLRTLKVRAHVRGCACCASFEASLRARRRDLGLLFPPTGAAGGIAAALARLLGMGGSEPLLGGVKGMAVGLAVLAGGGAVVATSGGSGEHSAAPVSAAPLASPAASRAAASAATREAASPAAPPVAGGKGSEGKRLRPGGKRRPGSGAGGQGSGAPSAAGGDGSSGSGSGAGGGSAGAGSGGGSSGSGSSSGGSHPTVAGNEVPVSAEAPAGAGPVVDQVGDTVSGVTESAGQAVSDTVDTVTDTASGAVTDTVDGATDAVTGAIGDVSDTVGDVAGGVTGGLTTLP